MHIRSNGQARPRVVVVGAGFGGLGVVRALAGKPVDVLLIDRNNYHAFWPLMYQVATAGLEPQDIAQPVRAIVRRVPNLQFLVTEAERIDLDEQKVVTTKGSFAYDELVVASGSENNFFGL